MSMFDRLLNSIKYNDDVIDDDEYFDEDEGDEEVSYSRPQRRIVPRDEEEEARDLDSSYERNRVEPERSSRQSRRGNIRSAAASKVSAFRPRREPAADSESNNFSVCVIKPRDMEDALEIARMLIAHCTVILNLEGLDLSVSQRIFDFASGSCCAIRGKLDKISNYIFVLTPSDVDISGEFQEILTGAFDPVLDLEDY